MANLYDNSTINSNLLSSVFNKLYSAKAMATIRRRNGLLYAIMGKQESGSTPGVESFERVEQTNGAAIEVRTMGLLRTPTVVTSSNAVATLTLSYDSNIFGSNVFDYTLYADVVPILEAEVLKIKGSESKTASYVDDVFQHIMLSLENTIGNAITALPATTNTTFVNGDATAMSSIFSIISDGVSTYTTTNYATQDRYLGALWGKFNRNDSANIQYRSYCYGGTDQASAGAGQITLSKIYTTMNKQIANGGMPSLAVADPTVYGYVQALTAGAAQVMYDENSEWNAFGGTYLSAFGMKFCMDQRLGNVSGTAPNTCNTLFLIDPTFWKFYKSDQNLTPTGIVKDVSRLSAYVMPYSCHTQLVCSNPAAGGSKIIGISG